LKSESHNNCRLVCKKEYENRCLPCPKVKEINGRSLKIG
jgi:hypothetical protein